MKLLFAVDLREEHRPVFDQARDWAVRMGAKLDLVFVGIYDDIYHFVADPTVRKLMAAEAEHLRDAHLAELEALLELVPEDNRGRCHLPAGPPAPAIVAMEEDYDALVVATHGRTGIAHLWLGSVAERVVRTTNKPVIVLRMPAEEAT